MIKLITSLIIIINLINSINCFNIASQYKNIYPFPNLLGASDPGFSHFPVYEDLILHIRCYYNKDTAIGDIIIFDSGMPMFSTAFGNVIQQLITNNTMNKLGLSTACFFDRYGYGWSQPSPDPIKIEDFSRKLRGSIAQVKELAGRKFFYAGWSYGGLDAQMYAMLYPSDIKGLLVIDSTDVAVINDPKWLAIPFLLQMLDSFKSLPNEDFKNFCRNGSLSLDYGWISDSEKLPTTCIEKSQAIYSNPNQNYLNTIAQELSLFIPNAQALDALYKKAPNPVKPLGNTPLVVMSSNPENEPLWFERQLKLTQLSTNSFQQSCQNHFVVFNQPNLIITAINVLITKSK